MNTRMRLALSVAAIAIVLPGARAGDESPVLYGIKEKIKGKTYAEWGVAFCQWAYSIPKDRNPAFDATGKFAHEGQNADVFFLAGNFGGVTRRKLEVPADKPIFSPLVITFPFQEEDKAKPEELAQLAKEGIDRGTTNLEVTLDGKSIGDLSKHRAAGGPFQIDFPTGDAALHPSMAGKRKAVVDGYWFALKPLPEGEHTIKVRAGLKEAAGRPGFELNITYTLKSVRRK
jgi:hypothetical protein